MASTTAEQAVSFHSIALELIEDLMAFTLNRVRQLKAEHMFDNTDARILTATLDHLALDARSGVSISYGLCFFSIIYTDNILQRFSTNFPVDENIEDCTPDLAKALRQEVGVFH